mmetsp:Transcript_45693/g.89974  ORF Transcript_45693/g.89974 Transcript_45693/m.89974 type:complete len:220 (-) Transcript_45693:186-845(-)
MYGASTYSWPLSSASVSASRRSLGEISLSRIMHPGITNERASLSSNSDALMQPFSMSISSVYISYLNVVFPVILASSAAFRAASSSSCLFFSASSSAFFAASSSAFFAAKASSSAFFLASSSAFCLASSSSFCFCSASALAFASASALAFGSSFFPPTFDAPAPLPAGFAADLAPARAPGDLAEAFVILLDGAGALVAELAIFSATFQSAPSTELLEET